ncbi:hypothetical protein PRIPAC_91090 [Pristionchus pacificus]|uniref:Uncharacterized protein n=1 Tax=Pristionchus pacificus TaxID=54126 RepID=A0A2A6B8E1_PRIPA|nr:hypothetical protein PRIPAC_91090 [Pristionchus pacificus]|eukprot:PDM62134.1 hypothetical protein PRIPAC_51576 [Pristionchus pacificus]
MKAWLSHFAMLSLSFLRLTRDKVNGFAQFHGYVCAAFLRTFSRQIQAEKDFQGIMILLQNLPTSTWGDQHICEFTADAFSLMQVFDGTKVASSNS